jgi:hypothetical protein
MVLVAYLGDATLVGALNLTATYMVRFRVELLNHNPASARNIQRIFSRDFD